MFPCQASKRGKARTKDSVEIVSSSQKPGTSVYCRVTTASTPTSYTTPRSIGGRWACPISQAAEEAITSGSNNVSSQLLGAYCRISSYLRRAAIQKRIIERDSERDRTAADGIQYDILIPPKGPAILFLAREGERTTCEVERTSPEAAQDGEDTPPGAHGQCAPADAAETPASDIEVLSATTKEQRRRRQAERQRIELSPLLRQHETK